MQLDQNRVRSVSALQTGNTKARQAAPAGWSFAITLVSVEISLDASSARTANRARELVFEVGQSRAVRPLICVDADRVLATIVAATDQQAVDAGGA